MTMDQTITVEQWLADFGDAWLQTLDRLQLERLFVRVGDELHMREPDPKAPEAEQASWRTMGEVLKKRYGERVRNLPEQSGIVWGCHGTGRVWCVFGDGSEPEDKSSCRRTEFHEAHTVVSGGMQQGVICGPCFYESVMGATRLR